MGTSDTVLESFARHDACIRGSLRWRLTRAISKLSMLDKIFSRRHFEIFFIFFPENRLWDFMHEMSNPLSGKNKKKVINLYAELSQRVEKGYAELAQRVEKG